MKFFRTLLAAVRTDRDAGPLRVVEVEGVGRAREMFVVTDRRRVLPTPARLFVNLLETGLVPDLTS